MIAFNMRRFVESVVSNSGFTEGEPASLLAYKAAVRLLHAEGKDALATGMCLLLAANASGRLEEMVELMIEYSGRSMMGEIARRN
jgi:hypothetical protein